MLCTLGLTIGSHPSPVITQLYKASWNGRNLANNISMPDNYQMVTTHADYHSRREFKDEFVCLCGGWACGSSLPRIFSSRKCRYYISSSRNANWELLARVRKKKMGLSPNCFKRKEKTLACFLTWLWFTFNIKGSYWCWRLCAESCCIHASCIVSLLLPIGQVVFPLWACSSSIYIAGGKVRSQNTA